MTLSRSQATAVQSDLETLAETSGDTAGTTCFHCALPVLEPGRYRVKVDGIWRPVCCPGCEAVAAAILGYGLHGYYEHRTGPAPTAELGVEDEDFLIYDDPEVQRGFVHTDATGACDAALMLEGVRCTACVWLNQSVLGRLPGVLGVGINATTHRAQLRWDPHEIKLSEILAAVRRIGYRAHPYDARQQEAVRRAEQKQSLWRLFVAGFGMMQVMMYALPVYLAEPGSMTPDIEQLMRWAGLILTLPVVIYSAGPFFQSAWRDLRIRRMGMDLPVALGIGVAFTASAWSTFSRHGEVYFDSVAMFVFLLLCGRYLETKARHAVARSLDFLSRAIPEIALRVNAAGDSEQVPVSALRPGDRVLVRSGERVPVDGVVEDGKSFVDESLLTGESRPVARQTGDRLTGGSTNVADPLLMRVERIGADTVLSSIVRLMQQAAAERPRLVANAERITGWFVATTLVLAAGAAVVWWTIEPGRALWVAVSVLVVTCPCALSLATPVALTVATGRLARQGLIVCRAHVVETLARATDVVLDKTGTLTVGQLRLTHTHVLADMDEAACLQIAAALERGSMHPIAKALTAAAPQAPALRDSTHHAGLGVEAGWDGHVYRLGRPEFVMAAHRAQGTRQYPALPAGSSIAMLGDESRCLALFVFGDALRPDARAFIDALRRAGKHVHLLSGDRRETVDRLASALGITSVTANASPQEKLRYVQALQRENRVVAMIGDGINDAPVLAQAGVSVAMGDGAWMSQRQADAVLLSGRLGDLRAAFETSTRTLAVIHENLFWALAYNLTAVPLAALGMVTPWMAGIGMSASSLLVILNSLRLLRRPGMPAAAAMPRSAASSA
ncbi:MAG: heavy metal translocating P-type ATPase [Burkholderiales bacterium]|nr:heavy metal translocating P-type ATPase [Burkholderiales bacterium]